MATRCVYCHGGLDGSDPTWDCPGCATRYHLVCRHEMPRCATLGCPTPDAQPERSARGALAVELAGPSAAGGGGAAVAALALLVVGGLALTLFVGARAARSRAPSPAPPTASPPSPAPDRAAVERAAAILHRAAVLYESDRAEEALAALSEAPAEVAGYPRWSEERRELLARIRDALPVAEAGAAEPAAGEGESPAATVEDPVLAAESAQPPGAVEPGAEPDSPGAPSEAASGEGPGPQESPRERALAEALSGIVADNLRGLLDAGEVDPDLLAGVVDRARTMAAQTPELVAAVARAEERLAEARRAAVRQAFLEAVAAARQATLEGVARGDCGPMLAAFQTLPAADDRSEDDWAFVREAAAAVAARRGAVAAAERSADKLGRLHAAVGEALGQRLPLRPGPAPGEFENAADGSVLVWVPRHEHTPEVGFPGFFAGKTEVTREQFAAFARATGRRGGASALGSERLPASGLSLQDAADYCAWAGLRLPTGEEWRLAAVGAEAAAIQTRIDDALSRTANTWGAQDGFVGLAPVGSFPGTRTPAGCLDMVGNVSEWVAGRPSQVWANDGDAAARLGVRMGASFRHGPGAAAFGELAVPVSDASADAGFRVARGFWD